MRTVKCLNEHQKDQIARLYESKQHTQKELADMFGVSTRTIGRVFLERGVITPQQRYDRENKKIIEIVRSYGLDSERLSQALASPALTPNNIKKYLSKLPREARVSLFYTLEMQEIHSEHTEKAEAQV